DGSTANTQTCVERLAAVAPMPLRHVWQPDQGFRAAMARNRGTLAARGDYIVFLDGDCIPQRDFIARHRALSRPGCLVSGSRNLGVWRSDLERVNGFDESFVGWGYEDSDLVLRLFHAGVARKDGAFATEVFHLWHREARRDQESSNRAVVLERAGSRLTQAVT